MRAQTRKVDCSRKQAPSVKHSQSNKKNQQAKPKTKQTDVFTQEEAELQQAGLVSTLPDEPWGKRKDRQSRSILITINNPQDSGITREGESVLFLDEYRNQLPISTMLTIADIYPLKLPARYYNRKAAYTKLYIATNLTPKALYATEDPSSRHAFWRRVIHLYEVQSGGKMVELKKEDVA